MFSPRTSLPALLIAALCICASGPAVAGPPAAGASFLMGPYVNSVDDESALIVWVSGAGVPPGEVTLRQAAGGAAEMVFKAVASPIEGRPELLHVAAAKGLKPFTRYRYAARCGDREAGGDLVTAARGSVPFRFVVAGDSRSRPDVFQKVSEAIARERPAFVVMTGDLVSSGERWQLWGPQFFAPGRSLLSEATLWPVRGNHEGDAVLYRELFVLPGNELWYSFDFGNLHCVVLDTQTAERARMLEWFKKDLAASKAEWTIVSYHIPSFNVAGHGSTWGWDDFLPVIEQAGVDVVICGHSHLYERFVPIGEPGKKPVIHVVSGGAGAPNHQAVPNPLLVGGVGRSVPHYCVFSVDGNRLDMAVKQPDGTVIDRMSLVKTDGMYQPDLMRLAVPTERAKKLVLAFRGITVELADVPQGGKPVAGRLASSHFPAGSVVAISSADGDAGWRVAPTPLRMPVQDSSFQVVPPPGVKLEGLDLVPPLRLQVALELDGKTYRVAGVPVRIGERTIRMMVPEPQAVEVPRATGPMAVDGELSDWGRVRPLPEPFEGKQEGSFRFCWTERGLYGAVQARDDAIKTDEAEPWKGDCVELFVEKDYARSLDRSANSAQYVITPAPDAGPGPARFMVVYGTNRGKEAGALAAWRPVPGGYTIEFFIPASMLAPARMAAGTKLGLNFVLNDDGVPVEQFYTDKQKNSAWRCPLRWGAVRLQN